MESTQEDKTNNGIRLECRKSFEIANIYSVEEFCSLEIPLETLGVTIKGGLVRTSKINADLINALQHLRASKKLDFIVVETDIEIDDELAQILLLQGIRIVSRVERRIKEWISEVYTVKPRIGYEEARKIFVTQVKSSMQGMLGSMLSHKKIEFQGLALAYFPLKCYQLLLHSHVDNAGEIVAEEAELCFELATGSLMRLEDDTLYIDPRVGQLGELEEEVVNILALIGERGEISIDEISEIVGSIEKAEVIVQILIDYGLLEHIGLDKFKIRFIEEKREHKLYSFFRDKGLLIEGRPSRCSLVLDPEIDLDKLDKIISVFGRIIKTIMLYLPIYIGVFKKGKNDQTREIVAIIDGLWGERLEDLEEIIASSRMLYRIYEIMNTIMKKESVSFEKCPGNTNITVGKDKE